MMSLPPPHLRQMKPVPASDFIMPLLIETAKELLDDERVKSESICLMGLEAEICKKIYGKLWKRNKTGLALMLETTGWMRRFVQKSIIAIVRNLGEKRGDANAE